MNTPHSLRPRHTMRQITATHRRDRLLQQIASCDTWKSLSLRSVAQIQTCLNLCDISQRQTKRKRLVAAAMQMRRLVAATCHRDLSHRVSRPLCLLVGASSLLGRGGDYILGVSCLEIIQDDDGVSIMGHPSCWWSVDQVLIDGFDRFLTMGAFVHT